MKSTGIVRKIDILGRIVIPKEIRNRLNIDENDNIEIYIDENMIILKKYSIISDIKEYIRNIGKALTSITSNNIIITDKEEIIYSNKLEINDKKISNDLKKIIKEEIKTNEFIDIKVLENFKTNYYSFTSLIKNNGNNIGIIIMYSKNPIDEKAKNIILNSSKIISEFYN